MCIWLQIFITFSTFPKLHTKEFTNFNRNTIAEQYLACESKPVASDIVFFSFYCCVDRFTMNIQEKWFSTILTHYLDTRIEIFTAETKHFMKYCNILLILLTIEKWDMRFTLHTLGRDLQFSFAILGMFESLRLKIKHIFYYILDKFGNWKENAGFQ